MVDVFLLFLLLEGFCLLLLLLVLCAMDCLAAFPTFTPMAQDEAQQFATHGW